MKFYINFWIPERFAGYTVGPVILIRPSYRNDRGLLEHEKVHVRQFWQGEWFNTLTREVEAYKEQAKWYNDDRIPLFATFIATKYGLNIDAAAAERLLRCA